MPVYWSMLAVTLLLFCISYVTPGKRVLLEGKIVYKTNKVYAFLSVAYVLFFVGFRDKVLDTYWYIGSYKAMPTDYKEIIEYVSAQKSGVLFFWIEGFFKKFVTDNYYGWLFFVAGISCVCIFRNLYKYSIDFPMTMYLFIAGGTFTWLINGIRQFLAVSILFAFSEWLIEGKKIQYIILVIIVTFIHSSAIILIPICLFVDSKKILGKKMIFLGVIVAFVTQYMNTIVTFLGENTDYDYTTAFDTGVGSGVTRLMVASVPLMIVILNRKLIEKIKTPSIVLAINMSCIGVYLYVASTLTNGILVGRLPIYFTLYNLYLLPWLIKKCFTEDSSKILKWICIIFYGIYFYYQMIVAWHGLTYVSEFLRLYY